MSATSCDVVVVPSAVRREKTVTWVDTYYYNLNPHTLLNWNPNVIWTGGQAKAQYIDIGLEFQFVRISELEFRITCIKTFGPSGNYTLNFQCSGNVFGRKPEVFEMESSGMILFQQIWLDASYRDVLSSDDLNREIELKIVVKMIEYDCEPNDMYRHQEAEFQKAMEEFLPDESVLIDLCYILDVPRLQDIFTGRQNNEFAQLKTLYISRTASFAKEIAGYLRAKRSCTLTPVSIPEESIILNFILKGERAPIGEEVLRVYYDAHYLGLGFLVHLCRDVISMEGADLKFNLDALQAAECFNDERLFDIVAEYFDCLQIRRPSEDLLGSLRNTSIQCRFVVLSLETRMKRMPSELEIAMSIL